MISKYIKNSAIKAWNGEEKLWKVFWLWGVFLYTASFLIGPVLVLLALGLYKWQSSGDINQLSQYIYLIFTFYSFFVISLCGVIITIIYPIIFLKSLNRCSGNISLNSNLIKKFMSLAMKLFSVIAIIN